MIPSTRSLLLLVLCSYLGQVLLYFNEQLCHVWLACQPLSLQCSKDLCN